MRQLKGDQQIEKNTASAAKRHLTGQGTSPLSGRDVMRRVEAEQAKGQLSSQTQKEFNRLMKSSPARIFEDPKTGITIIVKEIDLRRDEEIYKKFPELRWLEGKHYKVFVKTKNSNEAIEAPVIHSNDFDGQLSLRIRTAKEDLDLEIGKQKATLIKGYYAEKNGGGEWREKTFTLREVKSHHQVASIEAKISNYSPGALTKEVKFAGSFSDGRRFVITCPPEGFFLGLEIYVESGQKLKRLDSLYREIYRDGGTTIIYTEEGNFYFPVPAKGPPRFIHLDRTESQIQLFSPEEAKSLAREFKVPLKYHGKLPTLPL